MKICDLTQFHSPVGGGVRRYLQEKNAYVRERTGHIHLLIIPGERDARQVEGRSITYTVASPLVSKTSRYRALLRLEAVQEILEIERPDLIESGDPYQVAWKALRAGATIGAKVLGFYHSHFPEAYLDTVNGWLGPTAARLALRAGRAYARALYNRFDKTLVPSAALARLLQTWGINNVQPARLGVDAAVFNHAAESAPVRAELGIPKDKPLLLYVGRLAPEKNTALLCRTFEMLAHDYHLLVVGDGQQRHLVQNLASSTGSVSWLPYCADSSRLAQIYRAADLFVHPGVKETFGLVALESQACGTPVIGIRGSYMDAIIHTDQAHWAAQEQAESLACAVRNAPRHTHEACQQLSRHIHEGYAWPSVFERLFDIYKEILNARC